MLGSLTSSTYDAVKLGLNPAEMEIVLDIYMEGLRYTFILYTVCTGVALLASLWIGNTYMGKTTASEAAMEEVAEQVRSDADNAPSTTEKGVAPTGRIP
jgi:hypothetical protein